ncbi:glycoside hydrolase family 19 protein [Burkholderia sp. 22PA0106]|uniref:glycoside hydrolase family 19 protein n=1 Tax=Burkholderia sp. 22PA0106 TaxID=3237371 RepID=UPI0039C1711D
MPRKNPLSKPPEPALPKLTLLPFAFPFFRKRNGNARTPERFTNEHDIFRLLAENEPAGAYLVSRKGMWHGGIHITETGAGQGLDLDAGLRCLADGELIAFRADKTYPTSEIATADSQSPVPAPYSTGFALVRHTMAFPRDTTLTFYSLYMHLMSDEDYANFPKRDKPSYWLRQWRVTSHARDKPVRGRNGQPADPFQQGLRVRMAPNGAPIAIVPQGAGVMIGERKTVHGREWGQIDALLGASLYPLEAGGYVELNCAIGGWILMGHEGAGAVVEESVLDSTFDRVIVAKDLPGNGNGIPIKAGDLIGHLGRYDSLNACTSGTRMAHIEVFCDDGILPFIEQGRAWIREHGPHKDDWAALGLPFDPALLRIAPGTALYRRAHDGTFIPGADAHLRKTDALQLYRVAALARDPKRRVPESNPLGDPGYPVSWWHVEGVNALGHPIDGWVRDSNFPGGRVTREFAQKWIDFQCLAAAHDPAHTIFATTQAWLDYANGTEIADSAARSTLSPLMSKVYDALFTTGNGEQAADELCMLSQTERGAYPWHMLAASRLIVKHESEWANPSKWRPLIAELEKQVGPKPAHAEELKRIEKLVWWDEVRAAVPGFPAPVAFQIHPIAIAGNFLRKATLTCKHCDNDLSITETILQRIFPRINDTHAQSFASSLPQAFTRYEINSCARASHFLGQCEVECNGFTEFRENLRYIDGERLWATYKTSLTHGLKRLHPEWTMDQIKSYAKTNLIKNDSELGEVLFGDDSHPGKDYRGRGLLHVTWRSTYGEYAQASGVDVTTSPDMLQNDPDIATDSAAWFWQSRSINTHADTNDVRAVTRAINPALKDFSRRKDAVKRAFSILNQGSEPCSERWNSTLDQKNGW